MDVNEGQEFMRALASIAKLVSLRMSGCAKVSRQSVGLAGGAKGI